LEGNLLPNRHHLVRANHLHPSHHEWWTLQSESMQSASTAMQDEEGEVNDMGGVSSSLIQPAHLAHPLESYISAGRRSAVHTGAYHNHPCL